MPTIVRFEETGGPHKLRFDTVASQQPRHGEVRLRVEAVGLNRAESMFLNGSYFEKPVMPSRIGVEAVGMIDAVGPDIPETFLGKRVATTGGFSQSKYGVLGEEAIVPAHTIVDIPSNLNAAQGAATWISFLTAWGALIHFAGVGTGDHVLIPAASSSVGLAAIQTVRDAGGYVIATTRSSSKTTPIQQHGAHHVIVTEDQDVARRVREITNGSGARVAFDPVGGPFVETLADAVASLGTIFLYGGLSGQDTVYPLAAGLSKGLSLRGYSLTQIRSKPSLFQEGVRYVTERLENGIFKPVIAKTFNFAEAADAYRYLESNAQVGKVVVRI